MRNLEGEVYTPNIKLITMKKDDGYKDVVNNPKNHTNKRLW